MPHVIVKMVIGRSEAQKARIAEAVANAVIREAACAEAAVSVSLEEFAAADWTDKVYRPDILAAADRLYKKPGYEPS